MALPDLLVRLLEFLGIKKSDSDRFRRLKEKIHSAKAAKVDQLESLKDQHRVLERKALGKKKEYDASKGNVKRIIAGEIDRIFKDIDRLKGQEAIIGQGIDKLSLASVKIDEILAGSVQDLDEDVFDDLAVDLEDIFAEHKRTDRAAKALEDVSYEAPQTAQIDVESRMAEFEGEDQTSKESPNQLPESTVQRLKELAGDD